MRFIAFSTLVAIALTGAAASKVEAAVKAKYPGATVSQLETSRDGEYEATVRKADGPTFEVHVSKDYATVTEAEVVGIKERAAVMERENAAKKVASAAAAAAAKAAAPAPTAPAAPVTAAPAPPTADPTTPPAKP